MFIKDLFFPKICLGCGFLGAYLCPKCRQRLHRIEKDTCLYCGRLSYFGLTHPGCCKKNGIDGLICLFYYNETMRKIIKNIKYQLAREIFNDFLIDLRPSDIDKIGLCKKLIKDCFIQSIPLHPSRLRQRGFNQAELIAKFLSNSLNYPQVNILERKTATPPLAQIRQKKDRYLKIRGAFDIKSNLPVNKKFIVVDDVITTGSTVKEAARILKRKGAVKVYIFALAKG